MKNIVALFFSFIFTYAFAQFPCGSEPPIIYNGFSQEKLNNELRNISIENRKAPQVFMMSINIIRSNSGTQGASKQAVLKALERVNEFYNDANIQFELCTSINYIDNSDYLTVKKSSYIQIVRTYNLDNTINIYIAPEITVSNKRLCGFATFPNPNNHTDKAVFLAKTCVVNGSTFSHELGHFFGLLHTHEDHYGKEKVARTNCTKAGDYFCDTPADPRLSHDNTFNCTYIGTDRDVNGDKYNPDVSNLMSYAPKNCRNTFSNEQLSFISLIGKSYNSYILNSCDNLPDIILNTNSKNIIKTNSFKNRSVDIVLSKDSLDIEKPFKISAGFSNSEGLIGDVFFTKSISFTDNNENIELTLDIPINQKFINSKYLNIWADSNNKIDEKNEYNNKIRIKLDASGIKKSESFIYPNPVKDGFNFFTNNKYSGKVDFTIQTIDKKIVFEDSFYKYNRYYLHQVENLELKSGVYILYVSYGNEEVKQFQFIKL